LSIFYVSIVYSKKRKEGVFVRNKVNGGPFSRQGINTGHLLAYQLVDVGRGPTDKGT
jgi:hypothetical protein